MGVEGFIGPEVFISFLRKLYMWGHLHQQRLLEADAVVGKTWIWWFTILTWNCWSTIQLIGFGGPAIYNRILFGNHLLDLQLTTQVRAWDNLASWFATSIRKEESAESGKNGEESGVFWPLWIKVIWRATSSVTSNFAYHLRSEYMKWDKSNGNWASYS